jgi:hypothetical protein
MRNSRWFRRCVDARRLRAHHAPAPTEQAAWVGVLFRILAAGVGGYGVTYASTAALTVLMPLPKPDAVLLPTMLSFIFYVAAILWAFTARSAGRAWLGLLAVTLPCAAVALLPAVTP